jgi:serine/threonine protein kinase
VTHFDLKPGNILIDGEGCLKLADFGESRLFAGSITKTLSQEIGSLMYMAPELLDEEKKGYLFLFYFYYLF